MVPSEPLIRLHRKIESAIQRLGFPAEERKYTPHVTLARLRATPPGHVMDFVADHALYASGPFEAKAFALFSSRLTAKGSVYVAEREYETWFRRYLDAETRRRRPRGRAHATAAMA